MPKKLVELCILYYAIKEKLKIHSKYHKQNDSDIHGIDDDILYKKELQEMILIVMLSIKWLSIIVVSTC